MRTGAFDVVPAVSNHDRVLRVNGESIEDMSDDFGFGIAGTVEFAARHSFKVRIELKVSQNSLREDPWLRGGKKEASPLAPQGSQELGNAWVNLVLIQAYGGETFAIERDGFLNP